jgi:hypothetical protein
LFLSPDPLTWFRLSQFTGFDQLTPGAGYVFTVGGENLSRFAAPTGSSQPLLQIHFAGAGTTTLPDIPDVPEPGTLLLLGSGVALLFRRRVRGR